MAEPLTLEELQKYRELILSSMVDEVSRFLYYNRKESEYLPMGVIEQVVAAGLLTADEIADRFKEELKKGLGS